MVKMDNSQIEYVELTRPDVVTVAHSEHSLEKRGFRSDGVVFLDRGIYPLTEGIGYIQGSEKGCF